MVLRDADPADAAALADAWYAMLEESGLLRPPVAPDWREVTIAALVRGLAAGRQRWVVVEEDGRVVATGGLFLRRGGVAGALIGIAATIAGVYTDPAHRRRGYAEVILTRLIRHAREEGCDVVRLRATPQGRQLLHGIIPYIAKHTFPMVYWGERRIVRKQKPRLHGSTRITDICTERIWTCASCGTPHDRDVNAAMNLA